MVAIVLLPFALSLAVSLSLTWLVRELALRWKLVDPPGAHKQHQVVTPALGGIAVYLALLVGLYFSCVPTPKLLALLSAATLVALTGALDDLRRVPATQKLAMLGLASTLLCLGGWPTGLGLTAGLNWIASFFWVGLVSSAFNGVDNADGAAGGLAALSAGACALLGLISGDYLVTVISLALAGALLGFLWFNFPRPRATIFLGDSGSLVIGLVLACLSLEAVPVDGFSGLLFASLLLAVPLFDFGLILILRGLKGQYRHWREPITMCARDHTFHRLQAWQWSGRNAILLLYLASSLVAGVTLTAWFIVGVPGIHFVTMAGLGLVIWLASLLNRAPLPDDVYAAHRSTR